MTCSAFLVALAVQCTKAQLPHPGILLLDSPLVAYKDPDAETDAILRAGVKENFFRTLATGLTTAQVIVFENELPPEDLSEFITHIHFTRSAEGRYGLFPAIKQMEDATASRQP